MFRFRRTDFTVFVILSVLMLIGGAAMLRAQEEPYAPVIDPANFVEEVNHPYFPLMPGTTLVYEGESEDGLERIEVTVLPQTRVVMGVKVTVVRDSVWLEGELIEDTFDWFAQDREGNVWYFGEDTHEYEDGVAVNANGAWEAGVDGAQPGIIMLAQPEVGVVYRQEYYAGEAEDMGEVLSLTESASTAYGDFDNLLMTRDWTPLEPGVTEHKYYAEGIGLVLEVKVEGDESRVELVEVITQDTRFQDDDDGENDEEDSDDVQAPSGTPIISAEEASQAALAHVGSGEVSEVELEHENGLWVYGVEIGGQEITVDAITGQVLTTESDDD